MELELGVEELPRSEELDELELGDELVELGDEDLGEEELGEEELGEEELGVDELELLGSELLELVVLLRLLLPLLLEGVDEAPSAVRHSELRSSSVRVVVLGRVESVLEELGIVELGVFVVDEEDDEEGAPSAVRHSELRCSSLRVVVPGELVESVLEELGVFAALGVFVVDDDGVVRVVVDSATRLCSCTVCCCLSLLCMVDSSSAQLAVASALSTAVARILDAWLRMTVLLNVLNRACAERAPAARVPRFICTHAPPPQSRRNAMFLALCVVACWRMMNRK